MALQASGKVQLEQHDMDVPGAELRGADQLVDIDQAWSERAHDALALALADIGQGLRRHAFIGGRSSAGLGARPTIGASASTMSRAQVTSPAPA
jgi:hypothetical protein